MATIYKLIIEDDEGKTTVYPLSQGDISIGRKEGNTIRLMERNVSRRHARLMRNNGTIFIEDLDSYNGIRINGERINGRYEVKEGDLVEIGDYHLALQAAEIEEELQRSQSTPQSGWQAGTVPEHEVPSDLLQAARAVASKAPSLRDTLVDTPHQAPILQPTVQPPRAAASPSQVPTLADHLPGGGREPIVAPPPRGEDLRSTDSNRPPALPPFPASASGLFPPRKPDPAPVRAAAPAAQPAPRPVPESLLPTVPVNVGPAKVSAVPRLICVSTNYAGREFALTRPELIIGRVEDNDIVIEHRSVSRNHAKVVFDGRAHKIIDLQSANGILVNGEEYAMTDLRKGDLIELGHVRFRFLPAGEPFTPTDEELKEMREAGVSPPVASDLLSRHEPTFQMSAVPSPLKAEPPRAQPVVPRAAELAEVASPFDPSTAATVTDTPISALASPIASPMIEPSSPVLRAPERATVPGDRNQRSDTAVPARAYAEAARTQVDAPLAAPSRPPPSRTEPVADQRATEINIAARLNGQPGGARLSPAEAATRPRIVMGDAPLPRPRPTGGGKMVIYGAVAFLLILLAVTVVRVAIQPRADAEGEVNNRVLDNLLKARKYEAALDMCHDKTFRYADQDRASKACRQAESELSKLNADKDPSSEVAPPPEPAPPPVAAKAPPPEKVARAPDRPRRLTPAERDALRERLERATLQALSDDNGALALENAKLCIDAGNMVCQRLLGVALGRLQRHAEAVRAYSKYLDAFPEAADRAGVEAEITKLKESLSQ